MLNFINVVAKYRYTYIIASNLNLTIYYNNILLCYIEIIL